MVAIRAASLSAVEMTSHIWRPECNEVWSLGHAINEGSRQLSTFSTWRIDAMEKVFCVPFRRNSLAVIDRKCEIEVGDIDKGSHVQVLLGWRAGAGYQHRYFCLCHDMFANAEHSHLVEYNKNYVRFRMRSRR